ncbi:hypothetical protein BFJ66_g17329 [Fusarium oxysporum f. sp. cepae]|nr:hypothetical protein BFJ66_g17329 [Fusarium oxysporum f. sp. cepae]
MPVIECSICLENFENEGAYRGHLEYHEHRAAELLQELRACMRHISAQPRLINGQSSPISQSSAINQPDTSPSRTRSWICPHPDCVRKLKRKSFERRKDLVRHAESHKDCEEECLFCEIPILKRHEARCYSYQLPSATKPKITTSNDPRATGLEVNKVDGNSIIASQDVSAFNDLLREMEFGYTASAPPTIDVSAMANHSILPRAPVVTCYTMDEPYYINPSRRSMELGISQFANGYVDGADRTG